MSHTLPTSSDLQLAGASLAAGHGQHSDDLAVDRFAAKMKAKLARARGKGGAGWDDPAQCSPGKLSAMLHAHVVKGDPVDVANFAMMIEHYGASISPDASPDSGETDHAVLHRVRGKLATVLDRYDSAPKPGKWSDEGYARERAHLPVELASGDVDRLLVLVSNADDVVAVLARPSPSPAIVKEAGEVERLQHVVDRDRYVVAIELEAIRKAVGGHTWLLEGRGPYAWDDDDYRREFGAAIENVEAALVPLVALAADKSDCTTNSIKVQEARDAARQYLDARAALSASNAAQVSK